MSTITTKQLRENMPKIIDDLRRGKSIQLSYRHKVIGILQPADVAQIPFRRGSPETIRKSMQGLHSISIPKSVKVDKRSIKEQITEIRNNKLHK